MKIGKEVKTGIIIAAGIAVLFWGINYLKGKDFFTSQKIVYAIYPRVDGLAPSNIVTVNGLKIGLIKNVTLLPDHSGNILVSMHINSALLIPRNSVAEIYSTDLLGTKGIRFNFGDSKDDIHDDDTLKSIIQKSLVDEVSAQVLPMKVKVESVVESLDSILIMMRSVFDERTKRNLKLTFESVSMAMEHVSSVAASFDTLVTKQGKLRKIFDNMESITNNLKNNNDQITAILNNFSSITDKVAKSNIESALTNAVGALQQTTQLLEKVNKGEGDLGQLATNKSLYNNLDQSAKSLDELLKDLKENPRRYLGFSLISIGKKN